MNKRSQIRSKARFDVRQRHPLRCGLRAHHKHDSLPHAGNAPPPSPPRHVQAGSLAARALSPKFPSCAFQHSHEFRIFQVCGAYSTKRTRRLQQAATAATICAAQTRGRRSLAPTSHRRAADLFAMFDQIPLSRRACPPLGLGALAALVFSVLPHPPKAAPSALGTRPSRWRWRASCPTCRTIGEELVAFLFMLVVGHTRWTWICIEVVSPGVDSLRHLFLRRHVRFGRQ